MLEAPFQILLPPPRGRVSVLILHLSLNSAWFEKLLRLKCLGPGALLAPCASEHHFFSFFLIFEILTKTCFLNFFLKKKPKNKKRETLEEWKTRFIYPSHLSSLRIDAPSFTCAHRPTHIYIHICSIISYALLHAGS